MTALSDLIARLEAAKEGSRGLGDEVLLVCGWKTSPNFDRNNSQPYWIRPDGQNIATNRPDPTTSLDAALTLVPDNSSVVLQFDHKTACDFSPSAEVYPYGSVPKKPIYALTPALAICIAALKAREAAR